MVKRLLTVLTMLSVATAAVGCEDDGDRNGSFNRVEQNSPVGLDECERLAADLEAQTGLPVFANDRNEDGTCNLGRRDTQGDGK